MENVEQKKEGYEEALLAADNYFTGVAHVRVAFARIYERLTSYRHDQENLAAFIDGLLEAGVLREESPANGTIGEQVSEWKRIGKRELRRFKRHVAKEAEQGFQS